MIKSHVLVRQHCISNNITKTGKTSPAISSVPKRRVGGIAVILLIMLVYLLPGSLVSVYAQSTASDTTLSVKEICHGQIKVVVEEMPRLVGGLAALQSRIKYPERERELGIEGRVYLQFVVGPKGQVMDVQVVRGINKKLDQEAVRAVRKSAFKPGHVRNGDPACVRMSLPIVFKAN